MPQHRFEKGNTSGGSKPKLFKHPVRKYWLMDKEVIEQLNQWAKACKMPAVVLVRMAIEGYLNLLTETYGSPKQAEALRLKRKGRRRKRITNETTTNGFDNTAVGRPDDIRPNRPALGSETQLDSDI